MSHAEKWDPVHVGLGSDVTLAGKDRNETGKRETVTNLIDSPVLLARKVSLLVNGPFFEEVANFIARSEEVIVTDVIIVIGGEFGL